MSKSFYGCSIASVAMMLAGCSQDNATTASIITFNIAERTDSLVSCHDTFRRGLAKQRLGSDGSTWSWVTENKGAGLLFCRKTTAGAVSAWREASVSAKGTHSLKFETNGRPLVFSKLTE